MRCRRHVFSLPSGERAKGRGLQPRRALTLAALLLSGGTAIAAGGWRPAEPGHAWTFPRDHWSHPGYRTEWWYFTGHLTAVETGEPFGFQFTIFRVGLLPQKPPLDSPWAAANLVMGHAAISELGQARHHFTEVLWREMPYLGAFAPFPDRPLAWARAPAGTDGRWALDWTGDGFAIAMEDRSRAMALRIAARPEKPLILEGPGGFSRKSGREGFASLYYSFTRLASQGTLTIGGRAVAVRGRAWMDREIGSSHLAPGQVGWDWFGLQLDDGRDLMLYVLRRADGSADHQSATLVAADGTTRWLGQGEAVARATGRWRSPATGADYPSGWIIEVPPEGLRLEVTPVFPNQENRAGLAGGLFYWEGAVRVRDSAGRPAGVGYVELTGYGEGSRPPI